MTITGIVNPNSMLFWYPRISPLPIPQPDTRIVSLPKHSWELLENGIPSGWFNKCVVPIAEAIGYPLFLRTDLASYKHGWDRGPFVKSPRELKQHIYETLEHNEEISHPERPIIPVAIVIREYIPMFSLFKSETWKNLPINVERRYFVKDGKVQCRHQYWTEEAVAQSFSMYGDVGELEKLLVEFKVKKLVNPTPNWRELLRVMNTESIMEVGTLIRYAWMVARLFQDYWSVDFCRGKDGIWYLIDMAKGEESYHYPDCKFATGSRR